MGEPKEPVQLELFPELRITLVEESPTTRATISKWAEENDVTLLFFDPPEDFDHAIVGLVHGFGQEMAVLYDQAKVLAAMGRAMGEEDAEEWFDFNTIGAYVGEATPRFLIRPWADDADDRAEGEVPDVSET